MKAEVELSFVRLPDNQDALPVTSSAKPSIINFAMAAVLHSSAQIFIRPPLSA
jgi:hypothetical protein